LARGDASAGWLPAGLPRIAALQRVDGDLVTHGDGLRRARAQVARVFLGGRQAEVLEATEYQLPVAMREESFTEVRVELGAWFDHWKLK